MVFIEARVFTRRLLELAGGSADEVLRDLQGSLLRNPLRGDLVQGLGGIRKSRVRNPARGKGARGGFRCLHLYLERREHMHLLFILDKDEQEDLDTEERAALKRMVAALKSL